MSKNLAYYRRLPYSLRVDRLVEEDEGDIYFCASYPLLPQVKGVHADRQIAISMARELFDAFVEAQLAWGEEIPEPEPSRSRKVGGLYGFKRQESFSTGMTPGDVTIEDSDIYSQSLGESGRVALQTG